MKLYDSHTHLNTDVLFEDWQGYLQKFIAIGGVGLVNSGANDSYNTKGIEITKTVEGLKSGRIERWKNILVKSTIGYHPGCCDDGEINEENIQQKITDLQLLYEANKEYIVAIGECGIDTYYPGTEETLSLQKKLFALQCDLAKALNLPLLIHVRKDFASGLEILKNYRDITIHFHCRSFGPEEVEMLKRGSVELGWKLFIGFCGNVTYKNAQNLRDSLAKVPLHQLLLETDAPRLSPQVVRGTTNHPANVKYIYDFVSDFLQIEKNSLSQQIESNFKNLYRI